MYLPSDEGEYCSDMLTTEPATLLDTLDIGLLIDNVNGEESYMAPVESRRRPTIAELALIIFLMKKAAVDIPADWQERLWVIPMDDGGMGSLILLPDGTTKRRTEFGRQASEHLFKDADGVDVLATLNIDTEGEPFELDMWKMDYSALVELPDRW